MLKGTEFNKCKTIPDIQVVSTKLKAKGEDPQEVNLYASKRKRELVMMVDKKLETLEKNNLKASSVPKNAMTHIAVKSAGNSNKFIINQDKTVEF